ncbi:MAG: hypothetical protein PHV82_14930 [Victivallaceae bacterium]|nr:hypothetical protein [Victivallaceae bacterium]
MILFYVIVVLLIIGFFVYKFDKFKFFLKLIKSRAFLNSCLFIIKTCVVLAAFLAFALSMRETEFNRFCQVKPLLELEPSRALDSFELHNHGGIIYFTGCKYSESADKLIKTPRRYETLRNGHSNKFLLKSNLKVGEKIVCQYRDIDLNTYIVNLIVKQDGFYIDGVPLCYRSKLFVSMSRPWLDDITSALFPKDWFEEGEAFEDSVLIARYNESQMDSKK